MVLDTIQQSIESWLLHESSPPRDVNKSDSDRYTKESSTFYLYQDMVGEHSRIEGLDPVRPNQKGVFIPEYRPTFSNLPATVYLCLTFIAMYVIQFFFIPVEVGSEAWINIFAFSMQDPSVQTLFVSLFSHGGAIHLIANTLAIFTFGVVVEYSLSRKQFIGLFLLAGVVAALSQGSFDIILGYNSVPSLGASGGGFGIIGYLLRKRPSQEVRLFFIIPIKLWVATVIIILGSIGVMIFIDPYAFRIAHIAHLAGFGVGFTASSIITTPIPDSVFK